MAAILRLTTGVVYVRSWSGTISGATLAADTIKIDSTNQDVILTREAAAVLQLGADAAGTTAYTIKGNDRITTTGVGGNLTLGGGRGFDTGLGGSLIFRTAPAAGAGVAGILATRLTLEPAGAATFTGNVAAPNVTLNTGGVYGFAAKGYIQAPADGQLLLSNNGATSGVGFDVNTPELLKVRTRAQTGYATVDALAYQMNGAGNATSANKIIKSITAIADNTPTDVFTVTIPNANHAAAIRLMFLSSNGGTDAFESSSCASGMVVVARTTGVGTVTVAAAISDEAIATVAAGATHTLAYAVSAVAGAVSAANTFTIQVTINDSGNVGSNTLVAIAELVNSQATGITIV